MFSFVSAFVVTHSKSMLLIDQLFVTLVKLRHNPIFQMLAHISRLSKAAVISMGDG